MEREDIVMSTKEVKRIGVIQQVIAHKLTQQEAGKLIGVVDRQVRRLVIRYHEEGERGLIHELRGRKSNRRHPDKMKQKALALYQEKYHDFGPTLAWEKLRDQDKIRIGCQTLRRWLVDSGLWQVLRKTNRHLRWRERKPCVGEMIQIDGSHHDWLEGRGPKKLVLMGYIDDATSNVWGKFYDYEGSIPAMDSFYGYASRYGLPHSVYLDRFNAYHGGYGKPSIEEELGGKRKTQSQFERALETLGVQVIHAQTPQAKGRIERLFKTFQDRLVKEMRLARIKTKEEANTFLNSYLASYNRRFMIPAKEKANLHRPAPVASQLKRILSLEYSHRLRNDNTIRHDSKLYQVTHHWTGIRPKEVTVQERINGRLYILSGNSELAYQVIKEITKVKKKTIRRPPKPPPPDINHFFKKQSFERYLRKQEEKRVQLAAA